MTAICISFSIVVETELLIYEHSVRTLLWSPEAKEVFGCRTESWREGFT